MIKLIKPNPNKAFHIPLLNLLWSETDFSQTCVTFTNLHKLV